MWMGWPTNEAIAQVRNEVGGVEPLKRHDPTDYANGEEFQLGGVRTEVGFTTVERIEWQLDQLLFELDDIASPKQKFLAGLAEGLPLYGEPLIERWQTRLRDYPENFRREMIRRHWNFFPLWYYGEAIGAPRQRAVAAGRVARRGLQPARGLGRSQPPLLRQVRAEADT